MTEKKIILPDTRVISPDEFHSLQEKRVKLKRLQELQRQKSSITEQLPHLYGRKWYRWARAFFESRNKMSLLCAANQISKSSTQIRKCIDWATNEAKWPELWEHRPKVFWYLYPSGAVADIEFEKKWRPEFMPRGPARGHPLYGWTAKKDKGFISQIDFNSGVSVIFKFYSQNTINLQTATVDAVFADEELPVDVYDEIAFRLAGTQGYFHMVFTATLGQDLWRRAMEPSSKDEEAFPSAFKQCVSMYDCLQYEDGTKTPWTKKRIEQEIIPMCKSRSEVLKRVFGRFVIDEGRMYGAFDPGKNIGPPTLTPPRGWAVYAGVDPGGGGTSHPAAIIFIAVEPGNRRGIIFRGWRGNGELTTASDIFGKYLELSRDLQVTDAVFDYGAKDFGTIVGRAGVSFNPANKSREQGIELLNSLFRAGMLEISGGDPELQKLVTELMGLKSTGDKSAAKDDLCDATRYTVLTIAWDWETLKDQLALSASGGVEVKAKRLRTDEEMIVDEIEERRSRFIGKKRIGGHDEEEKGWADDDFEFWNDQY